MSSRVHVLVLGCGAIGSRFVEAWTDPRVELTLVDREHVALPNVGVAAFGASDVGGAKATVSAARRRARGAATRAIVAEVRDVVSAGLVRAVQAVVVALDNPRALHDACAAIWAAGRPEQLVLVLTCGNTTRPGWLARLFVPPGVCAVCLFGSVEREADRAAAAGASCAVTTAPRASAESAEAAARAGVRLLAEWLAGDRSRGGCRMQADGLDATSWTARMPASPSPACPVEHAVEGRVVRLEGSVASMTVAELVAITRAEVGSDAVLELGRRGVPVAGLHCQQCGAHWTTPPYLARGAAALRPCACEATPRAFVEGHAVGMAALATLAPDLTLATWGAAPGDEFVAEGSQGRVRLRTAFTWEDIDDLR